MAINPNVTETVEEYKAIFHKDKNFDIVFREIIVCNKKAALIFIDGFLKDEQLTKILDRFYNITNKSLLKDPETFIKTSISYGEVETTDDKQRIVTNVLAGQTVLFIEGFTEAILIDERTYPQRSTTEPDKDKVFRGSHDGFVEALVLNTALIRRRIRDPHLCVQHLSVGSESKTDIAVCYMDDRVDKKLLQTILDKFKNSKVKSLTMNQESVAELLVRRKWFNPFPKFKFTERPDTTASHILEGDIAIVIDNSPAALLLPSTIFAIMEEANDYYFPPITGTYLKLIRAAVVLLTLFLTPTWLMLNQYPDVVPQWLNFILLNENMQVPLIAQLLILELAIDGMKLASLNTPNTLTTALSILAAIIVGDYAVQSGWFCAQALLYTAFVTLANFSQPGYELGYAFKFMRILILVLTGIFKVWGYAGGIILLFIILLCSKTMSGKCYLYPLIPFNWKLLKRHLFRSPLDMETPHKKQ